VSGVDEDAWLRVNNAAFASHAEQGGWNADILKSRMMETWFNPEGFRIHDEDGQMAGFCWTKMHDSGTHLMGEIYVIAVDPTFIGHGFGSLLTVAGLESLAAHGATEAMLYVDCNNTAAVAMYEKLGFTPRYRERAFVGDIHEKTKAS
jgi:mycothiol synthase